MREALAALDFFVVIDVAMTETARLRRLRAAGRRRSSRSGSRTFFNLEFPRQRLPPPRARCSSRSPGTLPEPEIHRRLVRALGALHRRRPRAAARGRGRRAGPRSPTRSSTAIGRAARDLAPARAGRALRDARPDAAATAPQRPRRCGALAQTCVLSVPRVGAARRLRRAATTLFDAMLTEPLGRHLHRRRLRRDVDAASTPPTGASTSCIPELLDELGGLAGRRRRAAPTTRSRSCSSAGERRSSTANTIFRDPAWRKKDRDGALRMIPTDAEPPRRRRRRPGARRTTKRGSAVAVVEVTDTLQAGPRRRCRTGSGSSYPDDDGGDGRTASRPTSSPSPTDRDWLAGTPQHKHVPARIEALARST